MCTPASIELSEKYLVYFLDFGDYHHGETILLAEFCLFSLADDFLENGVSFRLLVQQRLKRYTNFRPERA